MNEIRIRLFGPSPWGGVKLVRKDTHGNGDGNAFDAEEAVRRARGRALVLPIDTAARNRSLRQPGERDVIEDVVTSDAFGRSAEDARDQLVAACVVIQKVGCQAYG